MSVTIQSSLCLWNETNQHIECTQQRDTIFKDTTEHWTNGLCRLMQFTPIQAKQWIESVAFTAQYRFSQPFSTLNKSQQLLALKEASEEYYKLTNLSPSPALLSSIGICGHQANIIWANGVGHDDQYCLVGCQSCEYGWLIDVHHPEKRISHTVSYQESYFQGDQVNVGYGDYLAQKTWRMEKSRRWVDYISRACSFFDLDWLPKRSLDIGSGYGYMRKAFEEAGFTHDGIEISPYAAKQCEKEFGFKTHIGAISDFKPPAAPYSIITLFDLLEHVDNPIDFLCQVKTHLTHNGICVIRTPNLSSIEREIFGRFYHSIKYEHLHYFSPKMMLNILEQVGLKPLVFISESHLLKGFFNSDMSYFEKLLQGSDLLIIAQSKGACV